SNAASNCSISLNMAAPSAVVVAIASGSPVLTVPQSVTVGAGQTSASFAATTAAVSAAQNVTVTATANGQQQSASIGLTVPIVPSSVSCTPATVAAPGTASCTVTLSA